jgi:acetyl-CoA carboxylase biotin carboxyl carrier protein
MSLTAAEVAEIMRLVEQSGFDELTLEIDGTKISLRRGAPAAIAAPESAAPAASAEAATGKTTTAASDPTLQALTSPLLGTFYRAPKPGAPPFVEVGTQVDADTIVAIIEVMKLMNTVRAGVRGTIAEIVAADGELAEYGAILMRIRKSG